MSAKLIDALARIWPWSELACLRRELRAVKRSNSAQAKKANRLHARILILDRACARHREQEASDQAYIDALEARLDRETIRAVRAERKAARKAAA